jgi:hypothetical protein
VARHRLVVWYSGANPPSPILTFKCVKCKYGIANIGVEAVRGMVSGDPAWRDFLRLQVFGSWPNCREDNPQLLEQWEAWRAELPAHHP